MTKGHLKLQCPLVSLGRGATIRRGSNLFEHCYTSYDVERRCLPVATSCVARSYARDLSLIYFRCSELTIARRQQSEAPPIHQSPLDAVPSEGRWNILTAATTPYSDNSAKPFFIFTTPQQSYPCPSTLVHKIRPYTAHTANCVDSDAQFSRLVVPSISIPHDIERRLRRN